MRGGWVYVTTNRPNGTLYIGVIADIARRASEHREGRCKGLTKRHTLTRLATRVEGSLDPCRESGLAGSVSRSKPLKRPAPVDGRDKPGYDVGSRHRLPP
jgi:hypothetical protein